MRPSFMVFVMGAGLLVRPASAACGEDPILGPGTEVRVFAGDVREIPGVLSITKEGVATPGALVANGSRLVAVRLPGDALPVALPRPGARPIGKLVALDEGGVVVRFDGQSVPFRVPRDVIATLEVNRGGRRNVLKSVGIGFGVGALTGVAVGVASGDDPEGWLAFSAGEKAAVFGVGLGVIGAVIGAVAGISQPAARWEPVDLGKRHVGVFVEPGRQGGAGAGLRIAF